MLAVAALKEEAQASRQCFTQNLQKGMWEERSGHGRPQVKTEPKVSEEESYTEGKPFDQKLLAGMAGTSLDGEYLWQIGINVAKECAGQGLGHKLVRILKEEVLRLGKVPFYGTSESHTVSQTVGLKAGFVPAWTEVSVERIPKGFANRAT